MWGKKTSWNESCKCSQLFPENCEELPFDTPMLACDMRAADAPGGPYDSVEDMFEVYFLHPVGRGVVHTVLRGSIMRQQ